MDKTITIQEIIQFVQTHPWSWALIVFAYYAIIGVQQTKFVANRVKNNNWVDDDKKFSVFIALIGGPITSIYLILRIIALTGFKAISYFISKTYFSEEFKEFKEETF